MATKFDAAGMIVFPKPWIDRKGFSFGPTAGRNGLSLTIWTEAWVRHFAVSVWFDTFWKSLTISLHHIGTDQNHRSRHIRL